MNRRDGLFTTVVAGVVALTGCTIERSAPSSPPAVTQATMASTPGSVSGVVVNELPPVTPAPVHVVMSDPSLIEYTGNGDRPFGPTTFSVFGRTITVDDELNHRLVTYRSGRRLRSVSLPAGCCLDLRVEGHRYWTLGVESATEFVLHDGATRLTRQRRVPLPQAAGIQWDGGQLQRYGTGLFAVPAVGDPVLLDGSGPAPVLPVVTVSDAGVQIADPGFTVTIRTHAGDDTPSASLVARHGGFVYYHVVDGAGPGWGYVYQFTTTGRLVHTYTVHSQAALLPNRPLLVADDGRVYQLQITNKTARVLQIPPN
jgi:hypothetical protein